MCRKLFSDFCFIDDDLDMFGDTPANDSKIEADEVQWEYKESQDGELIGPCSTAKMLKVHKLTVFENLFYDSFSAARRR